MGSASIALLASPLARDLFSRAIVQSAYMQSNRALREETLGLRSAEAEGEALAEASRASSTAAALRAADPVKLFMAGLASKWGPEPVIDGVVLKRQLVRNIRSRRAGKSAGHCRLQRRRDPIAAVLHAEQRACHPSGV